jgi:hypothetical protein
MGAELAPRRHAFESDNPLTDSGEQFVSLQVPVGDLMSSGPRLVVDHQSNCVPEHFVPIVVSESFRIGGEITAIARVPSRSGPTSRHSDGQRRKSFHDLRLGQWRDVEKV